MKLAVSSLMVFSKGCVKPAFECNWLKWKDCLGWTTISFIAWNWKGSLHDQCGQEEQLQQPKTASTYICTCQCCFRNKKWTCPLKESLTTFHISNAFHTKSVYTYSPVHITYIITSLFPKRLTCSQPICHFYLLYMTSNICWDALIVCSSYINTKPPTLNKLLHTFT